MEFAGTELLTCLVVLQVMLFKKLWCFNNNEHRLCFFFPCFDDLHELHE